MCKAISNFKSRNKPELIFNIMGIINQNFEDLMFFFEESYNEIIENTNKMDDIYWEIEKEGINENIITELLNILISMEEKLGKVFKAEEIIYKEMDDSLSDQSSVSVFKIDNDMIMSQIASLHTSLNTKKNHKEEKDFIQAEMITIADQLQRSIHKKTEMFFREVRVKLPETKRAQLAQELYQLKQTI